MNTKLHPSILEHAEVMSKNSRISVLDAIDRIAKSRPDYYCKLPLMTRVREKSPPFAVHPHFVLALKTEAKRLKKEEAIKHADALDRVAFHAGFHDWKHVVKMATEYELTVVKAVDTGFVFALWYPQHPWQEPKWEPKSLESSGLSHDTRILFTASEKLKHCYCGEDAEGGPYVLGFTETLPDGSVQSLIRTEEFIDEIGADEYTENNIPDLFFFRYTHEDMPENLDKAREIIETALGPVRWNPQTSDSGLEVVPHELGTVAVPVFKTIPSSPSSGITLPALGDHSDMSKHIPVVHYVWLRSEFTELDNYSY